MSYENTHCPCGGKKERETMLCPDCVTAFANRPELQDYQNKEMSFDFRRNAALILLSLARKRRVTSNARVGR